MAFDQNPKVSPQPNIGRPSEKKIFIIIGVIVISAAMAWLLLRGRDSNRGPAEVPAELITGAIVNSDFDLSAHPDPDKVDMISFQSEENIQNLIGNFEDYFDQHDWNILENREIEEKYFIFGQDRDKMRSMQVIIERQDQLISDTKLLVTVIFKDNKR